MKNNTVVKQLVCDGLPSFWKEVSTKLNSQHTHTHTHTARPVPRKESGTSREALLNWSGVSVLGQRIKPSLLNP